MYYQTLEIPVGNHGQYTVTVEVAYQATPEMISLDRLEPDEPLEIEVREWVIEDIFNEVHKHYYPDCLMNRWAFLLTEEINNYVRYECDEILAHLHPLTQD